MENVHALRQLQRLAMLFQGGTVSEDEEFSSGQGSFQSHRQLQTLSSQVLGSLSGPEEKIALEAGMDSGAR
jgi:hypothetical protein